jgi:hypothetical protein
MHKVEKSVIPAIPRVFQMGLKFELWDEILVKNITKIVFETFGMTDFSIFRLSQITRDYPSLDMCVTVAVKWV